MGADHTEATRTSYDTVAAAYAEANADEIERTPAHAERLTHFASLVGDSPVLDVGCGPGHVTGFLVGLGTRASGVDLSPRMVEVARGLRPDIRFDVGDMTALDAGAGSLGGIVGFYSIIHLPPRERELAFAEFHRVLAPGGHLLLVFQVGDEVRHIEHGYGEDVSLDAYRLPPASIEAELAAAGFTGVETTVRDPSATESVPQAYVLVRG